MAKWLREYLGRGARRSPPRPPQPDYSGPGGPGSPPGAAPGALRGPAASPRHRLVRVGGSGPGGGPRRLQQGPGESEYSEPFEGEQDPAPESGCDEEPTGCPRQGEGRRVRPRRGPQLYDTPCDEWDTVGDSPGVAPTRQSRLPRDDERPADEYDQPWEWKKDHISRAFAGHFESPEHSPSLSPCPRGWYHGAIGRAGAETLLALCREGSFLVRDCETSPDDYSLSLR
ncbi:SH2 domain-containing adapter protein D [Malurus melanocephalus]|uniref:SH2 domain-containing adapter protein D n=1 Tax=Malurus melanocephalus TaxID=175006 RepID=UPI0025488DF1|nr:SH2 domain-containing adapter protein D [Malurus melanocephalus]